MDAVAVAEASVADQNNDRDSNKDGKDSTNGETENRFEKAVAAWRSIGLASLIPQLDITAADIVNHQKDAVLERKEVAQKTKDFRKLDDAGKLAEYKGLLKAYQGFVDLLTTHGKESSSAFLQLYTTISDAPDPFPLLEASVEALVTSEDTLPRITSENAELQKRVNKLSQELESTEAKLQAERQARKEDEEGSGRKTDDIEAKWRKVLEEKESNWATKERTLEEKIENQDRLFKELRANYEVSQRLGSDEQDIAAQKAVSAELQLVVSDLEKTSARLAEMEARNEQLRIELAQSTSQSSKSPDEDPQVLRLQSENSTLLRRFESVRFGREAEKRKTEERVKQLERHRKSAVDETQDLRNKLQKCSDYDEIKRELNMLKSIELSAEEDADDEATAQNGSAEAGKQDSLELLLLARNKKLSDDLTLLRVTHKELLKQLDELKIDSSQSKKDLEESQKLSARLENDLTELQEEAASGLPSSGRSVAGTYVSRYPQSTRRGRSSPTSSIISGFDGHSRGSPGPGEAMGAGSGILPMVQAQRDRFKQKTQQLEGELQKTYATVTSLRQEVASLQKDNLNLYEKTRYVSAYSRGGASSSAYGQDPSHTSMNVADERGDRWKAQYEANISPFAAFRGREAARAYKRMNMPERMVFSLTRIVLATRTSRNLFAGYCLALHLLVLFMLYWMSAASAASSHMVPVTSSGGSAGAAAIKDASPHMADWRQEDFG
ncbi:hypothetical protein LTR70_007266 [Exophiala xenobiotica]|uniref:Protein CASP n=1 Tax=Lithohypha guttulata TaxID=1690604 RepID=A0ABR0K4S5_9EURO|nr:hypothetical protein LTR24_006850 [Lithohypha guttulata]KAK5314291.1 hypothetical protein LTR70_007266 [Exophiala xenobiotica]